MTTPGGWLNSMTSRAVMSAVLKAGVSLLSGVEFHVRTYTFGAGDVQTMLPPTCALRGGMGIVNSSLDAMVLSGMAEGKGIKSRLSFT